MSDELTPNEIDILIQAIKAWKSEPVTSGLMGSIFKTMLKTPSSDKEADALENEREAERIKNLGADREDQAILLQAKLIHMKHNALVNSEFNPALTEMAR